MQGFTIQLVDARDDPARSIMRLYVEELVGRRYGRPITPEELEAVIDRFPADELSPPAGLMWLAYLDGRPVGCVGLRILADGVGEVARLFVLESLRRRGIARQLMDELEQHASTLGMTRLRLHTRSDLVEARELYRLRGFEAVEAFNDNPYADHWLERELVRRS